MHMEHGLQRRHSICVSDCQNGGWVGKIALGGGSFKRLEGLLNKVVFRCQWQFRCSEETGLKIKPASELNQTLTWRLCSPRLIHVSFFRHVHSNGVGELQQRKAQSVFRCMCAAGKYLQGTLTCGKTGILWWYIHGKGHGWKGTDCSMVQ